MKCIQDKKEQIEKALYNFLDATDIVQQDILDLIDKNNISKSMIAKHVDKMKDKLATLERNLKKY